MNVTFSWTFSQAAIVAFFSSLGELGLFSALLVLHKKSKLIVLLHLSFSISIYQSLKHSLLYDAVLFEGRIPF